jgi:GrpB-like predicted nucleotidyltransferase (UPF0157 family)
VTEPIKVIIAEYDPQWPHLAASRAEKLLRLGPVLKAVHHIGSTAVPGLAAKPIIDLMPLVSDLAGLDRLRENVESLGYVWYGEYGLAGRRYCTLSDLNGTRIVQLHFFKINSPHAKRLVAFRDYLRAHPEAQQEYVKEKRRAQKLHSDDSLAYNDEKAAWIRKTESLAIEWFNRQDERFQGPIHRT